MKKRNVFISLRNGFYKLTGKEALINQYQVAIKLLRKASDEMPEGEEKRKLSAAISKITEPKLVRNSKGSVYSSFSAAEFGNRPTLRRKIAEAQKLIREYNLSR